MENKGKNPNEKKEIRENLPQNEHHIVETEKPISKEENEEFVGDGLRFEDQPENMRKRFHKSHEEINETESDTSTTDEILDENEGYQTRFPAP